MDKQFLKAGAMVERTAKKLTNVSVSRGKTAIPKAPKDLENVGIRFDFDGQVTKNGIVYNKFQVQPNAGRIPSAFRDWRDANGGTHAVMGNMFVKKGGDKEDVKQAFETFRREFKGQ